MLIIPALGWGEYWKVRNLKSPPWHVKGQFRLQNTLSKKEPRGWVNFWSYSSAAHTFIPSTQKTQADFQAGMVYPVSFRPARATQ